MAKRLLVFTLLTSIIAVLFTSHVVHSAVKPQKSLRDRVTLPVRKAPVYASPILRAEDVTYDSNQKSAGKIVLNTGRTDPAILGYTTYDYQHNCTMARQVEHRGTAYIHFDWMSQDHGVYGVDRGIGYQVYDIDGCDILMDPGGIRIETNYSGYVGIDADPRGWAVITGHQEVDNVWYPSGFWDFTPGGPAFGVFTTDYPSDIYGWSGNQGTGPGNENIWPKIEWHLGTEPVLHMVTSETGSVYEFQTISYYRRVGPYGTGEGFWTDQRVIDSVMTINPTVVASPVSDKVAIVWNAPAAYMPDGPLEFDNDYENDVFYAISTNQGAEWADDTVSTPLGAPSIAHMVEIGTYQGGNITNYDPMSPYKAYCDISALITTEDELNIVWGCRRWEDTTSLYRRQSAIFHWAENTAPFIRPVVIADWDTGGECYGHTFGSDAAKMTISECDGKLYVLYTQFGSHSEPCSNYDNVDHVINGRLYMSVYDPLISYAWDRPQRITSTPDLAECTPGDMTGPGDCNSEYWASMARYGRLDTCLGSPQNVLDILYINDYAPGSCVQPESGVWTLNPVMWTTTPCRPANTTEPEPFEYTPESFGLCYGEPILIVNPDSIKTLNITLENSGIPDINVWTSAQIDSCSSPTGGAATTIDVSPVVGIIPGKGGSLNLTVDIITAGEETNITIYAHVLIEHDVEDFDPVTIPICMIVTDQYYATEWFTLETACKRLRVYNNGQMSNYTENESMDYTDDPDDCADIYLYDGSPLICRDIEGERKCFFSVYENYYASDHVLRANSPIIADSTGSDSYIMVSSECITADSAIGMIIDYFVPTHEDDCEFIIKGTRFWNRTSEMLSAVAVGEILDWDIPNYDHNSKNESGYDPIRNVIYQYCCTSDPCDSIMPCHRLGGVAPATFSDFKNSMTLENDVFVYSSGPFGSDAPLPPDTMYGLMSQNDGFSLASLDSCEDLLTLITYDVYDLMPGDTQCILTAMATSKNDPGAAGLSSAIDDAFEFAMEHLYGYCWEPHLDAYPGDANYDLIVNVADAVYIIAYIFKGGPAPIPYAIASGDANGDCECNVGDVVYIINYVFRGGEPPVDPGTWVDNCW